jgi:hypothetical protein
MAAPEVGHQGLAHKLSIAMFARLFPMLAALAMGGPHQDYDCGFFGHSCSNSRVTLVFCAHQRRSPRECVAHSPGWRGRIVSTWRWLCWMVATGYSPDREVSQNKTGHPPERQRDLPSRFRSGACPESFPVSAGRLNSTSSAGQTPGRTAAREKRLAQIYHDAILYSSLRRPRARSEQGWHSMKKMHFCVALGV